MPKSKMKRNLLIAVVMIAVVGAGGYFAYIKGILPKEITAVIKKTSTGTRIIGNEGQKLKIPRSDLEIIIGKAEMYEVMNDIGDGSRSDIIGVRVEGEVTNTGQAPTIFGMNNKYIFDNEFRAFPMKYAEPNKSWKYAGYEFNDLSLNPLGPMRFMFEYEVPRTADLSALSWGVLFKSEIIFLIKTNLNYPRYLDEKKKIEEPRNQVNNEKTKQVEVEKPAVSKLNSKSAQVPKGFEVLASSEPDTGGYAQEIRHKATGIKMVYVAPGEFMMGSPSSENRRSYNETQHKVVLTNGYYIGKYEVTQEQWEKVMYSNPSRFKGSNQPVETVNSDDCVSFCKKLGAGFRLPSEAEWEYAARGGNKSKGFIYSGSNNLDEVGWYLDNLDRPIPEVGKKKANELGLYDMSGNVREWCSDGYETYTKESVQDPQVAISGRIPIQIIRGGEWGGSAVGCRSANRDNTTPTSGGSTLGVRVVFVPPVQ